MAAHTPIGSAAPTATGSGAHEPVGSVVPDAAAVQLDGTGLTVTQIRAVADRQLHVDLAELGRIAAERSWRFADAVARDRSLYGRTTGVGANRSVAITDDAQRHVLRLLRSHATGAGEPRSSRRVRAMLVVRLNQLAAGGSGVNPRVLDGLLSMIRADALPRIHELGSIGTGDLSALATTALALLGEGPTAGRPTPPTPFGAADGLAFISSNAGTLADAALALYSISQSATAATVVAALTFAAVDGNAEAYSIGAERSTPFDGARTVCTAMRTLIGTDPDGVRRDRAGREWTPARIQDPFALRVLPQVQGALLDQLSVAERTVTALVNAPTENPLVLADPAASGGGLVAHHGGFFLASVQLVMDALALAVAASGQLVLGRVALLVEPAFTGSPPFLGNGTPGASGVMAVEYVAASALGSIRAAAVPAGGQSATLSRGVEDAASFASLAATQCLDIADRFQQVVACELVAAVRAHRMRPGRSMTGLLDAALGVCADLPADPQDRDLSEDLAQAVGLLPDLAGVLG